MPFLSNPRVEASPGPAAEEWRPSARLKLSAEKGNIRIATNITRLHEALADELRGLVDIQVFSKAAVEFTPRSKLHRVLLRLKGVVDIYHTGRDADIVLVSGAPGELSAFCLLKLFCPFLKFKLVSIDLILHRPKTKRGRLAAFLKRYMLAEVDLFINHFKRLDKYQDLYGISHHRSVFIPFKVNEMPEHEISPNPIGDYVLCTGRTRRDVKTFVEAIRLSGCPGLLHQESAAIINPHGTAAWEGEVPDNLTYRIDDRKGSFIDYISNARLVVIPRFRDDIAPAGIATYLTAMIRKRCCILSEGPGHDDVLTGGEAAIVAPEDPAQLATVIKRLWEDDELRSGLAERGYAYARAAGDERRLHSDILSVALTLLSGRP